MLQIITFLELSWKNAIEMAHKNGIRLYVFARKREKQLNFVSTHVPNTGFKKRQQSTSIQIRYLLVRENGKKRTAFKKNR